MLKLGSLLKFTQRFHQKRAAEGHKFNSCVDHSWLSEYHQKLLYKHVAGELLELQDLCFKNSPCQGRYIILRFRKLVRELEPEASKVIELFPLILCDSLDELQEH
ncbi:hypothetical protein AOLI_G00205520 [Acnodon oligacanthus]